MSYFIDVQGTLISDIDKKPIPGALEFIADLNKNQIPYVVVTNNTKEKSEDFYSYLLSLGFEIPQGSYLDPFMVLETILEEKDVLGFGPKEFVNVLNSMGFKQNEKEPKAILVASSKEFDSNDYAHMIEKSLSGAKIVGMHATSIYAKDGRRYPGVGAIMQMLLYATGKEYEIIGKPSLAFYEEALRLLNLQEQGLKFEDVVMISDDAIGDLCGIKELGCKSILVLSGKCKSEDEILHVKDFIDEIVPSIADVKGVNG